MKNTVHLFALAALLAACSPERVPEISAEDRATFLVNPVKALTAEHLSAAPSWNLPNATQITYQACVKDVGLLQPIQFQAFVIQGGERDSEATTNEQGCLNWTEKTEFNYLAPETFVSIERKLVAKGTHQGARTIRLAVNPWRTGSSAAVDLREGSVPQLSTGEALVSALRGSPEASAPASAKLAVESISIDFSHRLTTDAGSALDFQLALAPKMIRTGLQGSRIEEELKSGSFRLKIALIGTERQSDSGERRILATTESEVRLEAKGGVSLAGTLVLSRLPDPNLPVELAFRLEPIEGPAGLGTEEGFVPVSSLTASTGGNVRRLESDEISPFATGTAKTALQTAEKSPYVIENTACTDGSGEVGFYFSNIEVSRGDVLAQLPAEKLPRSVNASFNVCLKDSLGQKPVKGHLFEVNLKHPNGAGDYAFAQRTNGEGCLSWQEPIEFDYFAPEQYLHKVISLSSRQVPYQGVTREIPVYVNPWLSGPTFARKCTQGLPATPAPEKTARLDLTSLLAEFTGRTLEVDTALNLIFKRRYILNLGAKLQRHGVLEGRYKAEDLAEGGQYNLRILVLSPRGSAAEEGASLGNLESVLANYVYLSGAETTVTVRSRGEIIQPVTLPFYAQDLPLLTTRSVIVLQLSPLDRASKLRSVTVSTPFVAAEGSESGVLLEQDAADAAPPTLIPSAVELNIAQLVTRGREEKARNHSLHSLEGFRERIGLKGLSPEELVSAGVTAAEIKGFVDSAKPTLKEGKKLCTFAFPGANESAKLKKCQQSPGTALEFRKTRHVERILSRPDQKASHRTSLSVAAGYGKGGSISADTSSGSRNSDSVKAGASVQAGVNFFGFFGAGVETGYSHGQDWYQSKQTSSSEYRGSSASISVGKTLVVEDLELEFSARTLQCLAVIRKDLKKAVAGEKGLHLCDQGNLTDQKITETWYYVSQPQELDDTSVLLDSRTQRDQSWSRLLRGSEAFNSFKRLLEDKTKILVLEKDDSFREIETRMNDAYDRFVLTSPRYSDGSHPGLILE